MKEIKMIQEMEIRLNRSQKSLQAGSLSGEERAQLREDVDILSNYLGSQDWFQHRQMDEENLFPVNLARGVLSEDGIYHVLEDYRGLEEGKELDLNEV